MGEKSPINHLAAQGSTWRMVMYLKLVSINAPLVVFTLLDGGFLTIYFLTSAVLKIWDRSIRQSSQVPLPADMGYSTFYRHAMSSTRIYPWGSGINETFQT